MHLPRILLNFCRARYELRDQQLNVWYRWESRSALKKEVPEAAVIKLLSRGRGRICMKKILHVLKNLPVPILVLPLLILDELGFWHWEMTSKHSCEYQRIMSASPITLITRAGEQETATLHYGRRTKRACSANSGNLTSNTSDPKTALRKNSRKRISRAVPNSSRVELDSWRKHDCKYSNEEIWFWSQSRI